MRKRLIFRADANTTMGRGHLSRCLAVAGMIKDDIEVLFVCLKKDESYILKLLGDFNFQSLEKDYDLIQILNKEDLLWIDGYQFSKKWKIKIRKCVYKLIETNDIPADANNVDIVFNHTPGLKPEPFINIDANTKLYLGLKYALLRQNFLKHAKTKKAKSSGKGVFICFGGADTYNLGEKFTKELIRLNFNEPIYWVTNRSDKDLQTDKVDNLTILSHLNEEEMIHYMSEAKVVLIPSSVLSFEAMALRKPIFTCYFVNNQELIYNGLIELNLACGAGYIKNGAEIKKKMSEFMHYYNDTDNHKTQLDNQIVVLDGTSGERINKLIATL